MARMNLYFPTQQEHDRLRKEANRLGISPSALVRMALRKFYEKRQHEEKVEKHG